MKDKLWNAGTAVAAIGGGILAKKLTDIIWKSVTRSEAPSEPEDPDVEWGRAVLFAALSGAIVQLIRMVINRQSTKTYIKATGHKP